MPCSNQLSYPAASLREAGKDTSLWSDEATAFSLTDLDPLHTPSLAGRSLPGCTPPSYSTSNRMPVAIVGSRRLVSGVALAASTIAIVGCSLGGNSTLPPFTDPATQAYEASTGVTIANMTRVNSSVYTQDITVGTGRVIAVGDSLTVYYKGLLTSGYVFGSRARPDSSLAVVLDSTQLIRGWVNGIAGMKTGGTRKLVIGPESGYQYSVRTDATGQIIIIPSNSVLVFDVEAVRSGPKP